MKHIEIDKIKQNCSNDRVMLLELINIGIKRIDGCQDEINKALSEEEWDDLARIVHKLRPILFFCGITSLDKDLQAIEKDSKARVSLADMPDKIAQLYSIMQEAGQELDALKDEINRD